MKLKILTPRNDRIPDGYYNSSRDLLRYITKLHPNITTNVLDDADFTLIFGYPTQARKLKPGEPYGVFTMFESTKPPDEWKEYLQNATFIANPTRWGVDSFVKHYGIEPVYHIPLAYSQMDFGYIKREWHRKFTFLSYNNGFSARRKGFFELVKAFKIAFRPQDDVKLIIKDMRPDMFLDNQRFLWSAMSEGMDMEYINQAYSRPQLRGLLQEADCFVFPSRGEGWGHTPLEAMATGIPAIVPNAHGISDYYQEPYCVGYETHTVPAQYDDMKQQDYGKQYKADTESLAEAMYNVYHERGKYAIMSKEIAEYPRKFDYLWTAKKLLTLIYAQTS